MSDAFAAFRDSHRRVHEDPSFLDRFYQRFIASSDKVREKFVNTDFKRQVHVLEMTLKMVLMASRGSDAAESYLSYIAERHDRHHLDIEPELYGLWLDALMATVAESDPEYGPAVEAAWRETMGFAIDYMISRY